MRTDETQRRIAVVSHQFPPRKGSQRGEVARESLLHLGLQGAVLGVAPSIATHVDAVATSVAAVAELGVLLKCRPEGNRSAEVGIEAHRPSVGHHLAGRVARVDAQLSAVLGNRAQVELVQIDAAKRQEQSPAADIGCTHDHLVREFVFNTEVVVVGGGRALRLQDRA